MTIDVDKKKKMLSYRWAIFGILALAYFFVYFHRTSTAVLSPDIQSAFGVGAAGVALLGSMYFYAYTIMQLPSGILTDRWGPRKTVTISLSGRMLLVGNGGALAATTPLVLMTEALGMKGGFTVLGIITLIIAAMCWIIVRDHPNAMGLPAIEEIVSEETGEPIQESTSAKMPMTKALKITFGSGRKFWPLAVWFFFMYGTIMVYQGLQAGPFYGAIYGWGKTDYSILLMAVAAGMIFGCPLSGIISDRVLKSRKKVLIVGTLAYTVIWGVIWLTAGNLGSYAAQFAINFLFGFFGGFFVVSYAQIKELFPIYIAGTSTAALNLFPFAGGAILQLLSGYMVVDKTLAQFQNLWLMMFIMMIIACIAAFMRLEAKDVVKKDRKGRFCKALKTSLKPFRPVAKAVSPFAPVYFLYSILRLGEHLHVRIQRQSGIYPHFPCGAVRGRVQ